MNFSIKKEYSKKGISELTVLARLIKFLSAKNISCLSSEGETMSTFDMNDLLLVPPTSPIRLCQDVVSTGALPTWDEETVKYVGELNRKLYGKVSGVITENKIATTTAVMINELLRSPSPSPFYCIRSVTRGSDVSLELEIALPDFTLDSVLAFHRELTVAALGKEYDFDVIPTYFSWSEAALAFRYGGMRFGAIGYVNGDLLRINPALSGEDSNACIMGVPLKTFSELLKGGL